MLEDLTELSPKRLTRRLEELWRDSLPCRSVVPWEASSDRGLTVGLAVDARGRRDVVDLGRVMETEPDGTATLAWSALSPKRGHPTWRLLLHVAFARPVQCSFAVGIDIVGSLTAQLPLLLAADRLAFSFDGFPQTDRAVPSAQAPAHRAPLAEVHCAIAFGG